MDASAPGTEAIVNAFHIPLITELICWHATNKWNFQNIRRVNRQFNKVAVRKASMRKVLNIDRHSALDKFVSGMEFRIQDQLPFSNYVLHLHRLSWSKVVRFATLIGESISVLDVKYLTATHVSQQRQQSPYEYLLDVDVDEKKKVITLLQNVPNVTKLTIWTHMEIFLSETDAENLPTTFLHVTHIEIFSDASPRLGTEEDGMVRLRTFLTNRSPRITQLAIPMKPLLRARHQVSPNSEIIVPHIEALEEILNLEVWSNPRVKYTILPQMSLSDTSLPFFEEMASLVTNFINVRVIIRPNWNITFSTFMQQFLAQNDFTLEDLRLEIITDSSAPSTALSLDRPIMLPSFINLSTLYLEFGDGTLKMDTIYSMDQFRKSQFPSLKKLTLRNYDNQWKLFKSAVFPRLNELEFIKPNGPFAENWYHIAPNVESLQIHLNNKKDHITHLESKLYYIFKHFWKLSTLKIKFDPVSLGNRIPDIWNVLTGYLPRFHKNQKGQLKLTEEQPSTSASAINRFPSINSLAALRHLHLTGLGHANIYAIAHLTQNRLLRPLDTVVIREDSNSISEDYVNSLREKHDAVYYFNTLDAQECSFG